MSHEQFGEMVTARCTVYGEACTGIHILIPSNPPKLKMFKIERQYPEDFRRSREDAFRKTVKWISDI